MEGKREKPDSPNKHPEAVVKCRRCGEKIKVKNLYSGRYCSEKCFKEAEKSRAEARSVGVDA